MASIFDHFNKHGYLLGMESVKDWQMSSRSRFTVYVMVTTAISIGYTAFLDFPSLECSVLVSATAFLSTSYAKYQGYVCNARKYLSFTEFVFKVYDENTSGNRESILAAMTDKILSHCHLVFWGIWISIGIYGIYPCYAIIFNNDWVLLSPLMLPLIDENTNVGYVSLWFLNLLAIAVVGVGNYYVSGLFLTYVDFYDALVSLVEDDLKTFDGMWEESRNQPSPAERKAMFRNLMMQLMDLARYNTLLCDPFEKCSTVQVIACYFGTLALLFAALAINYLGGIGGCLFFPNDLLMCCNIWQRLQNQNDRIVMILYNTKWYTYDTEYQKDILFALKVFQNVRKMLVANIYVLNFETGLRVLNNIYSAIMAMLTFLE